MNMKRERVVIIGSGPAGLTAALYTARAQLKPVVIVGSQLGGQIATTSDVENYPGILEITGPELAERMREQAEKFGAQMVYDEVTGVDFTKGTPFLVKTYSEEYLADAVIVTIGATPRELKIPGEREYVGHGVSYCATCDGFFFRGKDIIVVGGGDSALQEGIFLTRFAQSVTIVHRRDQLRASVALQAHAAKTPKIAYLLNTVVKEIKGENGLTKAVTLQNVKTGETYDKPIDGVFIFIGHDPNSPVFGDQLAMDDVGYVIVDQRMRTSVEGVFAGGEIQDRLWKQAATSVGQGCAAAMSAIQWLEDRAGQGLLQPLDEVVKQA
jgi:thioredoxin reductase (NADPH)